jgi:hypothetical protein
MIDTHFLSINMKYLDPNNSYKCLHKCETNAHINIREAKKALKYEEENTEPYIKLLEKIHVNKNDLEYIKIILDAKAQQDFSWTWDAYNDIYKVKHTWTYGFYNQKLDIELLEK